MKDRDIDKILKEAAAAKQSVDPALVNRISDTVAANLHPVKALPPVWLLEIALILICWLVAAAGAFIHGPHGIEKMNEVEIALIFTVLAAFILLSAVVCVEQAIPGSRRTVPAGWLPGLGCATLAAVFALLFHDYGTEQFVAQGVKCLVAGLAYAVPAFLATWWVLRRGFFVNATASGLARGTLAGLAGMTMLELHCSNFEAPHVMVWHIAVIAISAAIGALVSRSLQSR